MHIAIHAPQSEERQSATHGQIEAVTTQQYHPTSHTSCCALMLQPKRIAWSDALPGMCGCHIL
jgi:hypothetical protein